MVDNCPCRGCEYRSSRCHAECPEYASWSALRSVVREREQKRRNAEGEYFDHVKNVAYALKVRNKGGRKLNGWK